MQRPARLLGSCVVSEGYPVLSNSVYVVIFAGGVGSRMRGANTPKQFLELGGKTIIEHTIEHFQNHPMVDGIVVACIESGIEQMNQIVANAGFTKVLSVVPGGETGQLSIYNGLAEINRLGIADDNSVVLVHDGVRPLIEEQTITDCIESVRGKGCTAVVAPAVETIIEEHDGKVTSVVDRSCCKMARAPQGFFFQPFFECHSKALAEGMNNFIDSISLMTYYGHSIHTVEGPADNIKITTRRDFFAFKGYMDYKEMQQLWEK